jgi:hypothetical protein
MVELGYQLRRDSVENADLATAKESDLRYDLFLGDIAFKVDGADFSAPWGWVPILDFAAVLNRVVEGVPVHGKEALDFTESDSKIWFEYDPPDVLISSSYSSDVARVDYQELARASSEFLSDTLASLIREFPQLAKNREIPRFMRPLAQPPS